MADSSKQSPRGRGNPQPLRVNNTGFNSSRGNNEHSTDKDFVHHLGPPGSAQSARPGTQGGQSMRSNRSLQSGSGCRKQTDPRHEQTIVGVGTHGLGDRGAKIHQAMRVAVFDEWLKKKEEQQLEEYNSPERIQAREDAATPRSPEQRRGERQNKITSRKRDKEYHDEVRAERFRKQRLMIDEDHKRQQKATKAFVAEYSADNVAACREQLKAQEQHRRELQSYSLPSLAKMRQETKEEKALWNKQQMIEQEVWEEEKYARRQYILDMKRIGQQNMLEALEDKRKAVVETKQYIQEKEEQRRIERDDLKEKRKITATEDRAELAAAIKKQRFKRWDNVDKFVTLRKAEAERLAEPILRDREQYQNAQKEVVKERVDAQRTPRGKDWFFEGCRKQFFVDRHAAADDIRMESARNENNVKKEKSDLRAHKAIQTREGINASHERQDKQRSRPGSRSPPAVQAPRGPKEAW